MRFSSARLQQRIQCNNAHQEGGPQPLGRFAKRDQ
jgi:hypothetical protein